MTFKPFTPTLMEQTRVAWIAEAEEGKAFLPDVMQAIEWATQHTSLSDNGMAYGVFETGSDVAVGICEVAISHPSRQAWVKLLRLRLRPRVEDEIFQNKPEGIRSALDAYIKAVIGVYAVKSAHNASTIKVYGRTQEQVKFLTLLTAALQAMKDLTFQAQIEGRWLVLRWK